jgi:hypothetical protein
LSKAMSTTSIPIKDADDDHNYDETQTDFNSSLVELLYDMDCRFSYLQAIQSAERRDARSSL